MNPEAELIHDEHWLNSTPNETARVHCPKRRAVRIGLFVLAFVLTCFSTAAQLVVTASPQANDFVLVESNRAAVIYVGPEEDRAVVRAATDLAEDIFRVTGTKPTLTRELPGGSAQVILVGTFGASKVLKTLVDAKKLDATGIEGQWESRVLQVVRNPVAGVDQALVIAGSDRRGAIFGVYDLSELIGVSPWHWWADVPVRSRTRLAVNDGILRTGSPAVKLRGIFLNDEDWGLRPWASETFEPETGNIGPKTYARIFELLLRLRANFLWPAMHPGTRAFNAFPEAKEIADRYGIVMGASHCEQMLCNNVDEWKPDVNGEYNYVSNRDGVLKYWAKRVHENGKYENVYTLGMRGIHDSGMPGGGTPREQADRLQRIIEDQRDLLRREVNTNIAAVPQIFCPYKEVLELYRLAPDIPPDITLAWPDDNWGYVRQYSNSEERQRSGGAGVYYHISYWGRPYDYLWLYSTPPALVQEEMVKAWDYGARTLWVVNVGDIKPAEIGIEFFLRLAWNPHQWEVGNVEAILQSMMTRDFGASESREIVGILTDYFRLNFQRKPEHMGFDTNNALLAKPLFSVSANGDEVEQRLNALRELDGRAEALGRRLPPSAQDAYFQLVQYPVRSARLMNEKGLSLTRYYAYSDQGRASAGRYLDDARRAHEAIQRETATYNERIAGGKWRQIMSANPRRQGVFSLSSITPATNAESPVLGIAVEGSRKSFLGTASRAATNEAARLPEFNRWTQRRYFIDVFNGGTRPLSWKAQTDADWIQLDRDQGENDARVWVGVDWKKIPSGDRAKARILISGAGQELAVALSVFNPSGDGPDADFVEDNRRLSIEAEHASARQPGKDAQWQDVRGLGYNGAAVSVFPTTTSTRSQPGQIQSECPRLDYRVWIRTPGEWKVSVRALPTWSIEAGKPQRCAVAFDNEAPRIISFPMSPDERNRQWGENVLRNAALASSSHTLTQPGLHTLKIWMVDPGIVIDSIVADNSSPLDVGYLGPPETRRGK